MKVMKLMRPEEQCTPTTPSERRVKALRDGYGWRPRMPTLVVRARVRVKRNSDAPVRNPDDPSRIVRYVSPVTGRSYPYWKHPPVR